MPVDHGNEALPTSEKMLFLEAARGIASIFVIFWHFSLAFAPQTIQPLSMNGLNGTPLFLFMNGPGAVTFFFVLSGFVLTLSTFRRSSSSALVSAAFKRLPRLFVPCAASILIGFLILKSGIDFYKEAASITGSRWLDTFGNANFPADFKPGISSAMEQTLLVFFKDENYFYNSNLWTMKKEFMGSMLAFMLAAGGMFVHPRIGRLATLLFMAAASVALFKADHAYGQFSAGVTLAYAYAQWSGRLAIGLPLTVVGLALVGIAYCGLNDILLTLAAMLLIAILIGNQRLAGHLSGRLGYWLGKMSFPIYLTHTLVLLTVSSSVFAFLPKGGVAIPAATLLTLAVTLGVTAMASVPFFWLESAWVPFLNRTVKKYGKSVRQGLSRPPRKPLRTDASDRME